MIEFKILNTPDKTQVSTYQHLGRELTIGRSEGDMIVDDPLLAPRQVRVVFDGPQALVDNLGPEVEVRLNGQPLTQVSLLKERDTLVMGKTTLMFMKLDLHPPVAPPPFEHPQAATRFTPESKEQTLLDALAWLESNTEETASAAPPAVPGGPKPPIPGSTKLIPTPPRPGGAPMPPVPDKTQLIPKPGASASPPLPPGKPPIPPRRN